MADDNVDISGMPDPGSIGLSPTAQADPSDSMPAPAELYKKHFGYEPANPYELATFMANPPDSAPQPTLKETASKLTGIPRAVAGYAASVPAGVASVGGQLTGALGAALDPDNASDYLEQGRERGRRWSAKVNKLADYVPATKEGAQFSEDLQSIPSQVIKGAIGDPLKAALPDNAYQAVSDVAQDIGTDLPALGAPGAVRAGVRGASRAAKAAKAVVSAEAATLTPPGDVPPLKSDVGQPINADTLRSQPNPIPPPEGTVASARAAAKQPAPATPEAPTAAAAPPEPTATPQTPEAVGSNPVTAAERYASTRALLAMDDQRGSTRLFDQPKNSGPQETPATPAEQADNTAALDALDKLSATDGVGGLPSRRASAIAGDYNATGNDWQAAKTGNESAQRQLASENAALHKAVDNIHDSTGSLSDDSVDPQTLGDRGRTVRSAVQGIEKHFDDRTDEAYDAARAQHGDQPMPTFLTRASSFLNDDANYMPEGFRKSAQARLNQLKTEGDNGVSSGSTPAAPGSVAAAEKFREWLNTNRTLDNMHATKQLVDHTDTDVSEHGGPGLFEAARNLRRHSYRMLEEPVGIKKLLTPSDSQGINHAIPEHKVMDYIADLPREQHEHVMNVLRAGAHLDPELAKSSAAAIREIQAHTVSRLHDAATDDGGKWNARSFASAATRYARNAESTFRERPDILRNLETVKKAGDVLHMDKSYPGAVGQAARSGILTGAVKGAGAIASSLAHEVPVVGRILGRGIEGATEAATGDIGKKAAEKAFEKRTVDRTGKQRGSVGVLPQRDAIQHKIEGVDKDGRYFHSYSTPHGGGLDKGGGGIDVIENPALGIRTTKNAFIPKEERGKGWGTRMLQRAVDDTHAAGQVWRSDRGVSHGQVGAYKNLAKLGYDVKMKPHDDVQGEYKAHGDHVFEVRPPKENGSKLNIGLHQGNEGEPGFRKMSKQEAQGAVESTGAKVTKSSVLTPEKHGVYEPTLVASTDRPLSEPEMQSVLAKTKQSAIPQRTDAGEESMHVAPGHEEIAKKEGWDKFNPEYFRDHDGKVKVPSGQRGSFSFENDNALNRATTAARNRQTGAGIEPRNERNERVANQQMGGRRPLSDEQNDILNRLSGGKQRGSVQLFNDESHEEGTGSQLNIGLHQGNEGDEGFRKMSKQEAQKAVESTGAKVTKNTVLTPKQHGVSEPTSVMSTDRPLSHDEMQQVLAKTKQSAIPQRTDAGETSMHVAPGHEEIAKKEGWDTFNPEYFREHNGRTATAAEAASKKIISPEDDVSNDNGNHKNSRTAFFGDSHLNYRISNGTAHVEGINHEEGGAHGHEMVRWLKSQPGVNKIIPEDVALDAQGFWNKMEDSGLLGSTAESRYPPHPNATVKDPKQSKFPGIYDDPKEIMQRLGAGSPESKHLQDIFGVTRKDLHDTAVGRGDVEPKTPIPGITQKGAGSAHADNIKTPENAQRLRDIIQAYKEHDPSGYHGMVGWYEMDPMYHSIKKILGGSEEAAAKVYHNLNSMTAYASPMSPVGTEIRRGTAAATMAAEGNFDKFAKHGNLPQSRAPEALKAKNFELGNEGTMAHGSQAPAMGRFLETGQEANAVKTGTYRRSSDAPSRPGSDYQNTQPVGDSHWSRGAGLADVRGAKGFEGSATGTEMKTLGKWYHDQIARHPDIDLPSTSAQAVQWGALSKETGVDSPIGAPKLEIWANQIASAADRAGITPKEMWQRIIKRLAK